MEYDWYSTVGHVHVAPRLRLTHVYIHFFFFIQISSHFEYQCRAQSSCVLLYAKYCKWTRWLFFALSYYSTIYKYLSFESLFRHVLAQKICPLLLMKNEKRKNGNNKQTNTFSSVILWCLFFDSWWRGKINNKSYTHYIFS